MDFPERIMDLRPETLSQLEKIVAERYIVPQLKNPSEETLKQVSVILKKQFKKDYWGEVGGSIFYRPEGLEFQIIKPKSLIYLEEQLVRFEHGKPADLSELIAVAKECADISGKFESEPNGNEAVYEMFKIFIQKPRIINAISKDDKKNIGQLYRELIIDRRYCVTFSELKIPGKKLLGMFHVHNDGSEPSPQDVIINQKNYFLSLVISAKKDYPASGIQLHLIYSGVSHLVYNGPVGTKPTK